MTWHSRRVPELVLGTWVEEFTALHGAGLSTAALTPVSPIPWVMSRTNSSTMPSGPPSGVPGPW